MHAFKHLKSRKHLLWIPASVPFIGSGLYYLMDTFKNSKANSSANNEYIYLPSEINNNLFLADQYETDLNADVTAFEAALESPNTKNQFQNIDSFSSDSTLDLDLDAFKLSQSCDFMKSVKLALSQNPKYNSFRPPLKTKEILMYLNGKKRHFELDELMTHLLKCCLTVKGQSDCAKYFTQRALVLFENDIDLNDIFFNVDYGRAAFDNYHIKRYQGLYFQAILETLFSSKEHAICLLENGLFLLLLKLREMFADQQLQSWICLCLSALSVYPECGQHLYHAGWIGILAQWLNSPDLRLSLEAAKVLNNLVFKEKLGRLLYILHPVVYQDDVAIEFDVIFIHGLRGDIFKTWRQSDTMKQSPDYTNCWPKSWISNDFPNCRILAVNHQTFLSNWNVNCGRAHSLSEKSKQLAQELHCANVGKRPIIWVTHSMGGILVKEMLQLAQRDSESADLLNQTKGVVFYSVPHKGSEMAVWSSHMSRIISPSAHVLELRKDSPTLIDLNEQFIALAAKGKIECLSFGEAKSSTLLRNPIEWKFLLVPEESANPGVGEFIVLPEDHFHTCKPISKESESYRKLQEFITKIVTRKSDVKGKLPQTLQQDLLLSSCIL